MNCKHPDTVPPDTKPLIKYCLPDGGHWILDFTDDVMKHIYIDNNGTQLDEDDTAQLISSYLVPINDKFFTPPLPEGTPEDLVSAADRAHLRVPQPYDEDNIEYGFHRNSLRQETPSPT